MTASQPSRAPVPIPPRPGLPRVALRYAMIAIAGVVLLVVLVAGCGAAPLPPAAPATIAPTTPPATPPPTTSTTAPTTDAAPGTGTRPSTPAPRGGSDGGRAASVSWPAGSPAAAARLQKEVDGGRQPWLLDPVEVATSYAGAELGYRDPAVVQRGTGTIDVRNGAGAGSATLTLAQTVRRGDGGIWLVTAVRRR